MVYGNESFPVARRDVLKTVGLGVAVGAVGLGTMSRPVGASSHTGAIFGTDTNDDIYSIDVDTGTATLVVAAGVSAAVNLNGNAYDAVNGRFYFTEFDGSGSSSPLYFVDVTSTPYTVTSAGTLDGGAASGTVFDGAYYYVKNGSDDLTKATLDASGVKTGSEQAVADITGDQYDLNFGDIVFESADTLYFSAVKTSNGDSVAGVVDLGGSSATFTAWNAWSGIGALQLALAADGTLYGQNAGDGQFYTIDPSTGALTPAFNAGKRFTDLGGDWVTETCETCDSDDLLAKYEFACVEEVDGECVAYDFVLEDGDGSLVRYTAGSFESKDGEEWEPVSATFGTDYCTVWAVVKAGQEFEVQELIADGGEVVAEYVDPYAISFVAFYCTKEAAEAAVESFPSGGGGGQSSPSGRGR